jgi:type IX secretion system PorP/SprF family membrane protein
MKYKMKKRNFKYYFVLIGIFLVSTLVKAQQDPQYTQYMYNMNVINPAYATDNSGVINLGGLYRTQWVGAVGAPKTATLFAHSPIAKRVEMGVSFINDAIGDVVNENNIYVDFAYVLPVSEKNKLSFGIKGGATFFNTNFNGFQFTDP